MSFFSPTPRSITMLALLQIGFIFGAMLFAGIAIGVSRKLWGADIGVENFHRAMRTAFLIYSYGYCLIVIPVAISAVLGFLINSDSSHEKAISWLFRIYLLFVFVFLCYFLYTVIYFLENAFWYRTGGLGG